MTWQAKLRLDYSLERQRTVARYTHEGPLRILQSLYPEGDAVCHNVLIHPPGGLVGGDTLALDIRVGAGAHGLITTPGATRFYRSLGPSAVQHTQIRLSNQSRLEWLPLENLCHTDCQAENRLMLDLAPGSECLGWDITALGLPHAQQAFDRGSFLQHLEAPGVWLERGKICATDQHLMQGSAGLAGNTCLGTLFSSPAARWIAIAGALHWSLPKTCCRHMHCGPGPASPAPTSKYWWCGRWHPW